MQAQVSKASRILGLIRRLFIYLLIEGLYSPINRTVSPQGFPQVQISQKLKTLQNMHIIYERKTYKQKSKVSPFGIPLVKKMANKVRRCWYHLPFWSSVSMPDLKKEEKNGQKQLQINNTI